MSFFCNDTVSTYKTVTIYPNNKPWVTKDLKVLLKEKKLAFKNGTKEELALASKKLKKKISQCKKEYKLKIEEEFKSNNMKDMWSSLKKITGYTKARESIYVGKEKEYADELNKFYCRFDCFDFSKQHCELRESLRERSSQAEKIEINESSVLSQFRKVNVNKACGPDKIKGRILRSCCEQLASIYTFIFNVSLREHVIPTVWKTAEIIPVPKKPRVSTLNDLRPVALTSVVFKCLEKIVLSHLLNDVNKFLDPFQFAYKRGRNVEDAVLIFMNNVLKHLELSGTHARALFIDFSSAFNTIQPHLMTEKLLDLEVNTNIVSWVMEFLVGRSQYVKLNNVTSEWMEINTGAPQGCVLSPFLYTVYTNNYRSHHESTSVIKFADDSSIIGLISTSVNEYFSEVDRFIKWCDANFLSVNVNKTKEVIFDFRSKKTSPPSLFIKGEEVEITDSYKYLGMTIDDKFTWNKHLDTIVKKANQRLYFLRKLRSFNIDKAVMSIFYSSTIESLILFGIVCYGGNIAKYQIARIDSAIKRAAKIINTDSPFFNELYTAAVLNKAKYIMEDNSHLLSKEFETSSRSGRLISKRARTNRYRNSFIPLSIRLLQSMSTRPQQPTL